MTAMPHRPQSRLSRPRGADSRAAKALLGALLRDVSRSFYKSLALLPARVRQPISIAYLLARTTDTIADTAILSLDHRLEALRGVLDRIQGREDAAAPLLVLRRIAHNPGAPPEHRLLARCEESLTLLDNLSTFDLAAVRAVLETIVSGQELDLRRFHAASTRNIQALETGADLDDYTFRVAGCVGPFWTRLCRAHLFPNHPINEAWLLEQAVRFGKGLQLVNILRDAAADLREGRCYFPRQELDSVALQPADLAQPGSAARFRPIFDRWLAQAAAHLAAGWDYTIALPWNQCRVRLACAWPLLIGARTLALLRSGPILDPSRRAKISRSELRSIILRSVVTYPFQAAWGRQFRSPLSECE